MTLYRGKPGGRCPVCFPARLGDPAPDPVMLNPKACPAHPTHPRVFFLCSNIGEAELLAQLNGNIRPHWVRIWSPRQILGMAGMAIIRTPCWWEAFTRDQIKQIEYQLGKSGTATVHDVDCP